jgi:hypothetical protein
VLAADQGVMVALACQEVLLVVVDMVAIHHQALHNQL